MDARRLAILEALGVEVLALRAPAGAAARATPADATLDRSRSESGASESVAAGASQTPNLCIVCAHGVRRDARLARLFAQITRALALDPSGADWLEADAAGTLPAPPAVPAYLVLGAGIASALGAQLSTAQQNAAVIAVSADVASLSGGAAGKRALWQVLKPIARRLAAERV
ncbi:MAG: hypothetical protein E6K53_08650 [Gammaproteobacteria bacterium]|nr:MAG: hypothetical protein E6K53_08650 [Gammaproteobacteria bacterium]